MKLTKKLLRELISYSPKTGKMYWRKALSNRIKIGDEVGYYSDTGYRITSLFKKKYRIHQLAFMYMLNYFPDEVDHINHNRSDNTWANLRQVTRTQNAKNTSKRVDNISGSTGISWDKQRNCWRAYIHINGVQKYLGRFIEKEMAIEARNLASIRHMYHPNHGV